MLDVVNVTDALSHKTQSRSSPANELQVKQLANDNFVRTFRLMTRHEECYRAPATPSAFAAMYEPTHLPVILEATLLLHNSPPTSTGPRHPDNISFPPSRFSQPIRSSLL
ncbi:hypothetical protein LA080_006520 [Diaporthe eres]|nr:hypothetical protein LA080_006520 [Diaporthe eres]